MKLLSTLWVPSMRPLLVGQSYLVILENLHWSTLTKYVAAIVLNGPPPYE